jgi:hypothetical protein
MLLGPAITWGDATADTVNATFTNAGQAIRAALVFDASGELADFVSDDRGAASADGRTSRRERWSTPLRDYRDFGGHRLFSRAEARWHAPEGEFAYLELELLDIRYDITTP